MHQYILRRLLLLPITLFCIILVNFTIINFAPGEPTTVTEISPEGGAIRQESAAEVFGSDIRYLQFREHYGLTLPVLFNSWPMTSQKKVLKWLKQLTFDKDTMPFSDYEALRLHFGDRARFIMGHLATAINDPTLPTQVQQTAMRFFIRGGTRQATLGPKLSAHEKQENRIIAHDNQLLLEQMPLVTDTEETLEKKQQKLLEWYAKNQERYTFTPLQTTKTLFFKTRFFSYLSRVVTLDFGTLRDDSNKRVTKEVVKRFKYSLTLSLIPMVITFCLCLVIGFTMALKQGKWPDFVLNVICLTLYATPIFVVAPFLIEKVALHHYFPFSHIPIPTGGFTSPESEYQFMTSWQRLGDVARHIFLPIIAILYGGLAAQSRLARTSVLEVMRQDYVRTAWSKGVGPFSVITKHIGRNAAITIVTSIAGSLGIVLGGSLIVETVFDINGFGKFFYEAVINRDYNVIMFSALMGSFLTLFGYLLADITYTLLDPRVTLE